MASERITIDHRVMAGVPRIGGTRIPVATVVGLVAEGVTTEEILADYPQLTREDCRGGAALRGGGRRQGGSLPLAEPACSPYPLIRPA
ncbi:MAG: DUF433 domain-containing protein [Acidimicrobiia bacterium]